MTRVDLKTFTFSAGSKSRSINNAVLGTLPKRLLFTMFNTDFNGSVDTNPYKFRHYHTSELSLYVNGKRVPSEGLTLDMDHKKTSVVGCGTLFVGSGIHHSNLVLQITHMYINGYFMLFDLTPDRGASEGHTHSPRMAISGLNCYSANHYPSRSRACCTLNMTLQS